MVIMKTRWNFLAQAVLFASLISPTIAGAQEQSIWKLGTFNHSSGEFRDQGIDHADPKSDLTFVVGHNKDSDWYRFQPGPANGMTGGRVHPYTLKFALKDAPRGVYHLKIAMLYETPRLSFLKLEINGHSGYFYFHPKLDFNAGDWEGTFVPQTSTDEKVIAIPASWLHQGENTLVFTAMDAPATPQNSLGAIAPGHTGLVYDALELTQDPSATYDDHAFSAQIEPTIFYRAGKNGSTEVVDVFASAGALPKSGTIQLQTGSTQLAKEFSSECEFGEIRASFDVPEWSGPQEATASLSGSKATATITPAKKWAVAIIPHEHLDVGFTDYAAKVAELHSQSIDAAMGLIQKTPDFRWTLDGSWVATQYLNGRSAEAREQFLQYVRDGSITIPPEFANQHTGNASVEALARSFYNQHQLAREYKLPTADAAQIVDVPAYTWGYASVLHDAGIKYFIAASNSWRAPIMLLGRWNEKSPFYWEGPDGNRVLMWYSRAYLQAHTLFGGPWRMESIRDSLPVFLQAYTRPDYTANTAIIFGTQLENTPLAKEQSEIVGTFNHEYAWPKLEFSTVHSAMAQIEQEWKGEIPVYRGDFGPYWEDGYGSDAAHTAIHRENQHRIATAEVLGAAVSSIDPRVIPDHTLLDDAWWNELTYDEHTWTYVGATTQPEHHQSEDQIALKGARVTRARNDIDESIQRGWAQLEALVHPKEASVAVFNSLNWKRSGVVETDLPDGSTLVDATTGSEVPLEVRFKGKGISLPGFGPGNVRVRFTASDVPAIGYKLFTIRPTSAASHEPESLHGNVFENDFYRVTIAPSGGAIASVYDKQLGRELVDQNSPYKFGAYLYVTGGDEYPRNSLYRFGAGLNLPALTAHAAQSATVVSAQRTPLGIRITMHSSATNTTSIETEIFLPSSQKQVFLTYRVHKERVLTRESAYIAFPFAVADPQFTYGSQTGWVNPAKDELAGGSREWYLPTTWAAVYNPQISATVVPLDAPLTTFGDIMRGAWPAEFKPKSSTIFSWLMNNYWGTNFPAWQGGDFTFRYAVTSDAKFDPAALNHFGWNALTPLERDDIGASTDTSPLPSQQAELLAISNSKINLLTWKRAEDGDRTILRLQDASGEASQFTIASKYVKVEQAWSCNLLEDNQAPLPVGSGGIAVSIKPFQVLTIRLHTAPR
ncbi:glycosyl hydrolases 38-like protein [Candidatus Koribacter versatilis Ellin345]|uniref:Glycosyl hydrolases 38-like protein n=2 Tax=Candidatus Korobacter versatilis TaxID=658062 RepID=Q1IU01_KORVE|nr:glycosyl hydrolases 38-like protein [Candidatus Koribacter versatilis Ellin345]